jgi:hypothetical protein
MAYKGSTELSSVANPPRCITAGMWGKRSTTVLPSSVGGQNLWLYNTTESCTDIVTANFFTDAFYLGMRQGDIVMGAFTTGSLGRLVRRRDGRGDDLRGGLRVLGRADPLAVTLDATRRGPRGLAGSTRTTTRGEQWKKNQKQLIQLPPNELAAFELREHAARREDRAGRLARGLLVPAFWAHHALKLKPLDEIRAHAEDGTWLANYVVLDCSRTWAKVQQLSLHRLTTADVAQTQASRPRCRPSSTRTRSCTAARTGGRWCGRATRRCSPSKARRTRRSPRLDRLAREQVRRTARRPRTVAA